MKVDVAPGIYVIAVSGGVDSMVLLDVVRQLPQLKLIVAHYNHGIRADSGEEQKLVGDIAARYGLTYEYGTGNLVPGTSEAKARQMRYDFLRSVQQKYKAEAILTAHHQDDLLETMILNLSRGTGRKGLTSLRSTKQLVRPLLGYPKQVITEYAAAHHIVWREDSTNNDDSYKRNYIRHHVMPRLSEQQRTELLAIHGVMCSINDEMDSLLDDISGQMTSDDGISRYAFIMLPYSVSREYLVYELRKYAVRDVDRRMVNRLVIVAKTAVGGKQFDIDKTTIMKISRKNLQIVTDRTRNSEV